MRSAMVSNCLKMPSLEHNLTFLQRDGLTPPYSAHDCLMHDRAEAQTYICCLTTLSICKSNRVMSSSSPTIAQTESKSGLLDLRCRCGWPSFPVVNWVLPLVAIAVTSFRLFCRARQGRLWIDDVWASFAMMFILALLVVDWLYLEDYGEPCFIVHDTYHLLKTPRQISSRRKGSTVLYVCSLVSWCLRDVKIVSALGSPNSFMQ